MKRALKGLSEGLLGIDFVEIFDTDGDKKVSWKELLHPPPDRIIKLITSLGTSIITILYFSK